MNRTQRRESKAKIKKNLPALTTEGRKNLFNVVNLQTNDELIESLTRLHLKTPYIDEYMRTIAPIVRPISIRGVFDAGERTGRGIAMTMLYSMLMMCTPATDACRMSKSTYRLRDWSKEKWQYSEGSMDDPTAILKIVYDIRMKKDF